MICMPLLSREDLNVFKDRKIIINNCRVQSLLLYEIFKAENIQVIGFYNNSIKKYLFKYDGVPVINWKKMVHRNEPFTFQSTGFDSLILSKMKRKIQGTTIEFSPFEAGKILLSFLPKVLCDLLKDDDLYKKYYNIWEIECARTSKKSFSRFAQRTSEIPIVICLPPKTGDYTLAHTIERINSEKYPELDNSEFGKFFDMLYGKKSRSALSRIVYRAIAPLDNRRNLVDAYICGNHKPQMIHMDVCRKQFQKIKIITAIREPISQNVSRFYQDLSSGWHLMDWFMGELYEKSETERKGVITDFETLFINHGSDAQALWEPWLKRYIYGDFSEYKNANECKSVQEVMGEFKKHILDPLAYPFDQEAGYTIIKEGNMEIFIYQLEKLNSIVPQLSEWMGVPFDKLEKGNVGEDKWIGESYKQAQKEIQITQEYFDRCYNEPYVKHFYSQEDIEKFKARWRPHIK